MKSGRRNSLPSFEFSCFYVAYEQSEALRQMEEEKHLYNMKLNQLRSDIQAGIASGDAGTLDADEIKRRCRARHADALRETERRYEAGLEEPIDWDVAKQELREPRE